MIFTDKLKNAINFASKKHEDQKRKILDYPYISHPLSVLFIISHHTNNEDVLVASVLHDTVEDTDTTFEEIENKFGKQVRDIVDLLTEDKSIVDKDVRKNKQLERFKDADNNVLLIKMADIINNFCDILIVLENFPKEEYLKVFGGNIKNKILNSEKRLSTIKKVWLDNPLIEEAEERFKDYKNMLNKLDLLDY